MLKHITAALAATALITGAAQAETISFADYASGNEGGVANGTTLNFGGVDITFRGGHSLQADGNSFTPDYFAYFDDVSGGMPAGVGVCRALDGAAGTMGPGADCADSGDDSIDGDDGLNELLVLNFAEPFDLNGLSFRDGLHNSINDSMGLIRVSIFDTMGQVLNDTLTFAELVSRAASGEFSNVIAIALGYKNTEFYLESISQVPVPAALPLLLSGLAGLGFASRQKKKAA